MSTEPWTQRVTIGWRPQLRFYEERFSLLRAFDDSGDLRAFRVGGDHVDARLFDPVQELSVRHDGLSLHINDPRAESAQGWDAIRRAVARLGVAEFTSAHVGYQHVVPISLTFEEAIAAGYKHLYTSLDMESVQLGDWAFLCDVNVAGPPEAWGQTEFGVVRKDEVPARLARQAGRQRSQPTGTGGWREADFKAVSIFADTNLVLMAIDPPEGQRPLDRIFEFWASSRDQVSDLVLELVRRLTDTPVDQSIEEA